MILNSGWPVKTRRPCVFAANSPTCVISYEHLDYFGESDSFKSASAMWKRWCWPPTTKPTKPLCVCQKGPKPCWFLVWLGRLGRSRGLYTTWTVMVVLECFLVSCNEEKKSRSRITTKYIKGEPFLLLIESFSMKTEEANLIYISAHVRLSVASGGSLISCNWKDGFFKMSLWCEALAFAFVI